MSVITECRCFFGITDTKPLIAKRKMKFICEYCNSENGLSNLFADAAATVNVGSMSAW